MAVIGRVDLDDKDNVIASDKLIEVAQNAKTFVGDAAKNIIDFRASYAGRLDRVDQRMVDGLNYLNKNYNYTAEQLLADNTRFTISNVNDKDEQVGLYTNIKADRTLDKNDVFGYYKLSSIGKPSNQDIEIFQLFKNKDVTTGTVGWVGVGNMSNNVFVPYYPMLLEKSSDMYEGYQATLPAVQKVAERPTDANAFFVNDKKGGFAVYPEGWRDSYYFSFEGLGGYIADAETITGTAVSAADKQYVQDKMTALQNEFNETFAKVELKNATETSRQMAAKAHATALAMIDYLTEGSFNDVAAGSWYADAVKNVVNKGLMAGTGKDTFAPDNQVTRAMMWTVLARLDDKDVSGASPWYAKAMTWATEKGVSDGTFPANSITREQLATMLWRAAGSPEAKGALTNFNDAASVSSWATQAMTWAVEQGLISGMGDGALNPQGNATRAQLAVILTAYAK